MKMKDAIRDSFRGAPAWTFAAYKDYPVIMLTRVKADSSVMVDIYDRETKDHVISFFSCDELENGFDWQPGPLPYSGM